MMSYAGQPLVHGDAALVARVQAGFNLGWPFHGAMFSQPSLPASDSSQGKRGFWPLENPQLNTLYWPSGASRWSCGWFLVEETALTAARASAPAAADFVFDDDVFSFTTSLYMLPAIPVERVAADMAGLYILPLVDERWMWWQASGNLSITVGTTTWANLYQSLGSALSITIDAEDVDTAYLYPSGSLVGTDGPLPPLLDLVARSCGQRVVRRLDGTVVTLTATTSLELHLANIASVFEGRRIAGHVLDLDGVGLIGDLDSLVPEAHRMHFPRVVDGLLAPTSPYTVTNYLSDLDLAEYGTASGRPGVVQPEYSAAVVDILGVGTISAFWPYVGDGITPFNQDEVEALAERSARDFYLWQLGRSMTGYAIAAEWVMEGHADLVEFRHGPDGLSTAVMRGEFLPEPYLPALPQYSPGGGTGGGSVVIINETVNVYNSTVIVDNSVITIDNTVINNNYVTNNYYNTSLNFHTDTTITIDIGLHLYYSGGTVVFYSSLIICGWWYWCWDDYTVGATATIHDLELPDDGLGGEPVVRLVDATGPFFITGIEPTGLEEGQVIVLYNTTAYSCTLEHQHAGSVENNRFRLPGGVDLVVAAGGGVILWHDDTPLANGWRASIPEGTAGANYLLGSNAADTAREWKLPIAGANMTITHGVGSITWTAVLDHRTARGDADYTILATDWNVCISTAFSVPRTFTLPAASSVNPGHILLIRDEVGGITSANTLTISRAGADTVNGGTSVVVNAPYVGVELCSDGVSRWSLALTGTSQIADASVTEAKQSLSDLTTWDVTTSRHGYAPKAPNDATQYLDGTGSWSVPGGTGTGGIVVRNIYTATADRSVQNTTSEGTLLAVVPTFLSSYMADGTKYRIVASGIASTASTSQTITLRIKWGGSTIATVVMSSAGTALSNNPWTLQCDLVVRSRGGSGEVVAGTLATSPTSTTAFNSIAQSTKTTLDTTGNPDLGFTAQHSNMSMSNTVTVYLFECIQIG